MPDWDKKPHRPANPNSWFKVYKKLVRESQTQINKDAELLKKTMDGIYNERSKHKLKQVELDIVKLPGGMKRAGPTISLNQTVRFIDRGTQHGHAPSQKQLKIERGEMDPNAPRKTAPPIRGVLDKLRRDARATPFYQSLPQKPTGIITAQEMARRKKPTASTIVKAPRGMIEEHRQASIAKPLDPTIQPTPVFNPRKRRIEHDDDEPPADTILQEREKRLKTFTTPSARPAASSNVRVPRSLTSTPALSSPSPSPPEVNTKASTRTPREPPPPPQVIPRKAAPPKATDRGSPAAGVEVPRANTSSPNNAGRRPQVKRKAPADIFMRPTKKTRPS